MAMGRPLPPLTLDDEEREALVRWARRPKTAQALALRARIILSGADGLDNTAVSIQLGVSQQTVGKWCPASTIFAGWRQSVLPVHLLGLAPLLGSVGPVAGDVKLEDDGVVHDPVNRRGGGHGVGEDALPLREDQV